MNTITFDLFVVPTHALSGTKTQNIINRVIRTGACMFNGHLITSDQLESIKNVYAVSNRNYTFYLADGYALSIARED